MHKKSGKKLIRRPCALHNFLSDLEKLYTNNFLPEETYNFVIVST